MKPKTTTIQDLKAKAAELTASISAQQATLNAVNLVIEAFEADMRNGQPNHREGSFTANMKDAIRDILRTEGGQSLHRGVILEKVEAQGLIFSANRNKMDALASYLSMTPDVEGDGKGNWHWTGKEDANETSTAA